MNNTTSSNTKVCTRCAEEKPIHDFRVLNTGHQLSYCLDCMRKQMRDYHKRTWVDRYARHKEVRKQRTKDFYRNVLRPANLALYGTCSSPERQEYALQRRATTKRETGFAKTEKDRTQGRKRYRQVRLSAIAAYGGVCECCGESRYDMLTFDHKEKTYYKDKIRGVALTYDVLRTVEQLGNPNTKYRLLCWNCNMATGFYGYCPHSTPALVLAQQFEERKAQGHMKLVMINAYGGRCSLCGERSWEFLTIDHINGNGEQHRKQVGVGEVLYKALRDMGWPTDEYRLLCANCNCSQKTNGWTRRPSQGGMTKLGRA